MAAIYEASEETKRIIQDWADAPFEYVWGKDALMPYSWFKKQPKEYQREFTLDTRHRNTAAWKEAAQQRRHLRRVTNPFIPRGPRSARAEVEAIITLPKGDEHVYVVKIEGNTNITGYGYSANLPLRARDHISNTTKDGSEITQWDAFGFQSGEAKAVEKLLIKRFPLADCTISGFQRESTQIERYAEVVEFVEGLQEFIRSPISINTQPEVALLHQ